MAWTSAAAIYLLIWTIVLFMALPFGVKTSDEAGEDKVSGQADSAPVRPMLGWKLLWTTVISALIMALVWAVFSLGLVN